MPEIMQCAICFKKVDHVEDDYVVWQVVYQHHPKIVAHAKCAEEKRRRPVAFDYDTKQYATK